MNLNNLGNLIKYISIPLHQSLHLRKMQLRSSPSVPPLLSSAHLWPVALLPRAPRLHLHNGDQQWISTVMSHEDRCLRIAILKLATPCHTNPETRKIQHL